VLIIKRHLSVHMLNSLKAKVLKYLKNLIDPDVEITVCPLMCDLLEYLRKLWCKRVNLRILMHIKHTKHSVSGRTRVALILSVAGRLILLDAALHAVSTASALLDIPINLINA